MGILKETAGSNSTSFFDRPGIEIESSHLAEEVQFGFERVWSPELGIGGAYGTWGRAYDNQSLLRFIEQHLERSLDETEIMNLSQLGFLSRHHVMAMSDQENVDLEVEVGVRLLEEAAGANGWRTDEVEAVLIGMTGPVSDDYTQRIASLAGIPDGALKVSVHKACDSSVAALHAILNPALRVNGRNRFNVAERLFGKKVLVGGIEGLSRFIYQENSHDVNALQLFANGAGVVGIIPGKTMKFLVGSEREVFDVEGVLQARMYYPHSRDAGRGGPMLEVYEEEGNHLRFSGLMPEPDADAPVVMAVPMGMVKLFVRTGAELVGSTYRDYRKLMEGWDMSERDVKLVVAHHANFKINQLLARTLEKEGLRLEFPWVVSDLGNVSAASNMIAFLRLLPGLSPGDHIMFHGFGAGTYFDTLVVEVGASL